MRTPVFEPQGFCRNPKSDIVSLSLSVSAFLILPFNRVLNSWRSVAPIGLNFGHVLYPEISFLAAKEGLQPPYGVATRVRGAPDTLGRAPLPRGPLEHRLAWILLPKNHIYSKKISVNFYSVWTPFDMDILRKKKHATDRNWH